MKPRHAQARYGQRWLRLLDLALDRGWTPLLPVWSWVIEHPEALIVVDAGASPTAWQAGHFDRANRFIFERFFRFERVDPLAAQMRRAGLEPDNVGYIVQTHLHFDHADGMVDFPRAKVLVADAELNFHRRTPEGSALAAWGSERMSPVLVNDDPWRTFPRTHRVTQAGDVRILPTPGHTPGHQSVVVETGDRPLLLAGDLTFNAAQAQDGPLPGISWSLEHTRKSLERVLPLLREDRIVYLASHDPDLSGIFQSPLIASGRENRQSKSDPYHPTTNREPRPVSGTGRAGGPCRLP